MRARLFKLFSTEICSKDNEIHKFFLRVYVSNYCFRIVALFASAGSPSSSLNQKDSDVYFHFGEYIEYVTVEMDENCACCRYWYCSIFSQVEEIVTSFLPQTPSLFLCYRYVHLTWSQLLFRQNNDFRPRALFKVFRLYRSVSQIAETILKQPTGKLISFNWRGGQKTAKNDGSKNSQWAKAFCMNLF